MSRRALPPARSAEPQARHEGGAPAPPVAVRRPVAAAHPGSPLDAPTRARMERSLGFDFSTVRIHRHDAAVPAAVQAWTLGEDLHFAPGRYRPGTPAGDALLGHELAHVVQQRAGRAAGPQRQGGPPAARSDLESEADRLGRQAATVPGAPVRAPQGPGGAASPGSAAQKGTDPAATQKLRPIEAFEATGVVVPGLAWLYSEASALADTPDRLLGGNTVRIKGRTGYFYVVEHGGKRRFVLQHDLSLEGAAQGRSVAELQKASGTPGRDWLTIIPDAVPRAGARALPERPGAITAQGRLIGYQGRRAAYNKARTGGRGSPNAEIATAGPLDTAADVTPEHVTAALASIKAARAAIQKRYFRPADLKDKSGAVTHQGHQAGPKVDNPKDAKEKGDPEPKTAEASARYLKWLETAAKPEGAADRPWAVFKRIMEWEGETAAVMTYDAANVTWGAGFAGLGARPDKFKAGPEMLDILFTASPEVRALFWQAGFSFRDRELVVVDPEKGWKLRGLDAEIYVRSNLEQLLSLMINVAQGEFVAGDASAPAAPGQERAGESLRRAVLDAQFRTFLEFTYRESDTGDADVVALKAHVRHSGSDKWPRASTFTTISDLVAYLYRQDPDHASSVVPEGWRHYGGKGKK